MAKYSRSALSMKESLKEISQPEGREISQHFLLPVRPSLHRRPGAHRAGDRKALHSRRHRGRRRAALGRPGTLDPLSGFQEERLLHSGFRRRRAQATLADIAKTVSTDPVRGIRIAFGKHVPLSGGITPKPDGDEAGRLRAHLAGPRLRYLALPAAAGGQHFAGRDRQCAHARDPGVASALAHSQRSPATGRVAEAGSNFAGVQRESGVAAKHWWKKFARFRPSWARAPSRNCCAKCGSRRRW